MGDYQQGEKSGAGDMAHAVNFFEQLLDQRGKHRAAQRSRQKGRTWSVKIDINNTLL